MSLSFHLLTSTGRLTPALVTAVNNVYIIRTIDPELPHQCSVARIFRSANLPTCSGLIKTDLELSIDYFTDLGVSGPKLYEIWTSVQRARSIIASLWTSPPQVLIDLTSPALDECWTLYDVTRASLLHNWKLSSIPAEDYSTSLLLETTFDLEEIVHQSDKSVWLRTGLPNIPNEDEEDLLTASTIKWSINAVERYHQRLRGEDSEDVETDWALPVSTLHESLGIDNGVFEVDTFEMTMAESYESMLKLKGRRRRKPAIITHNANVQTSDCQMKSVGCQTDALEEVKAESRQRYMLIIFILAAIGVLREVYTTVRFLSWKLHMA